MTDIPSEIIVKQNEPQAMTVKELINYLNHINCDSLIYLDINGGEYIGHLSLDDLSYPDHQGNLAIRW